MDTILFIIGIITAIAVLLPIVILLGYEVRKRFGDDSIDKGDVRGNLIINFIIGVIVLIFLVRLFSGMQ